MLKCSQLSCATNQIIFKYLDSIDVWYDCAEGGEDKNPNISEYDTAIIKANICSLKHLYELEISYPGFVNDK